MYIKNLISVLHNGLRPRIPALFLDNLHDTQQLHEPNCIACPLPTFKRW